MAETVAEIRAWHKLHEKDSTSGTTSERWNCTLLAEIDRLRAALGISIGTVKSLQPLQAQLDRAEAVCDKFQAWLEGGGTSRPPDDVTDVVEAHMLYLAGKKE